jgi:hypothetical protein
MGLMMGSRRLVSMGLVSFCVLVGGLSLSGAASAAGPEVPLTEAAGSVGANTAVLNGELNPGGLAATGWYFALGKSGGCLGEGTVGGEGPVEVKEERVSAQASGLEPGTSYLFCLVAYNEVGETTVGAAQSFTTGLSQPVVDSEQASAVTRSSGTLEAYVNPEKQATNCLRFEYGETSGYGESAPCTPSSLGEGFGDQGASANIANLKPGKTYHFRVVVANPSSPAGGTDGPDQNFTTHAAVQGESFSGVGSRGVTFGAELGVYGASLSYRFEYGTTTAYGSSTPLSSTGNAEGEAGVTATVEDLEPSTEYHFRVVTEAADREIVYGADTSFVTLSAGIQGLPDDRAYEMVTPVDKEDAEVYIPFAMANSADQAIGYVTYRLNEVATNGDAVVYQADPTHNGQGESSGNGLGSAYLATRSATGGWSQTSIQPPGRRETRYQGFSSDLTVGVLNSGTENLRYEEPQLPGPVGPRAYCEGSRIACDRRDLYRHSLNEDMYMPLFSKTPKRAPEEFHGTAPTENHTANARETPPLYAGGSMDMSQLLFEANDALIEGNGALERELDSNVEAEITEDRISGDYLHGYLYDWSTDAPSLVDVSPEGRVVPNASFGAPQAQGVSKETNPPDFSHVISADGSRVFWTALEGEAPKDLYVRENATESQSPLNTQGECLVVTDACTVQLDKDVEGGGARFWTASSDGSKVFFTSKKNELYEYNLSQTVGQSGTLTVLTPGAEVAGVLGASETGDYIYYVNNAYELFMLHRGAGGWEAPVLIGTLSSHDGGEVEPLFENNNRQDTGDWVPDIGTRTAEVTDNGLGLAFMSDGRLRAQGFPDGYQNDGQEEVYVFDAASRSLFCASCSQSREPGSSGFLPVSWTDSYLPTLISEGGNRVFFDSGSALVSRDTDGVLDAYEWEREGTGSCGVGDGADGGCVYLLSGGTSSSPSYLLGASVSGSDVFVITRARLTAEAQDELFKVFDARVEGVKTLTPPQCTGTGCQGVPEPPPTFATPSSVTYDGVGNFSAPAPVATVRSKSKSLTRAQKLARALKACRAKPKKRRASCEVRARERYGPGRRAKRSSAHKTGRK